MSQKSITSQELASYLNDFLDPHKIDENSYNGLQVANSGQIIKIATAVTASLQAIEKAASAGANVLIVHHGICTKSDSVPVTGIKYRKIKALIENNLALLCYHLPLDAHRELGNNWKAARDLGLQNLQPCGEYAKVLIGVRGEMPPMPFAEFAKKVEAYYGNKAAMVKIKDPISSAVIISGGAHKFMNVAIETGADCYITGTFDEPVWDNAHDENISFLGLGHYATETVGVKALAEHVQQKFNIPCTFIKIENPF